MVLGQGSKRPQRKSYVQLWKLQCDCGKIIEIPRNYFECNRQVSCGCKRKLGKVDNNRRPLDISGQKFGQLTAITLTGKRNGGKPTWLLQCDCGGTCEMSLSRIRGYQRQKIRLNCREKTKHIDHYLEYPASPIPYPKEAGELVCKYLRLTRLNNFQYSAVEDEKRDRLLRAAWIIVYRRQQGEGISELHEKRIISKDLRYCSIDVFWQRKLDSRGGFLLTIGEKTKKIGSTMANITSNDYPVIETSGITLLSKHNAQSSAKRLEFKRC